MTWHNINAQWKWLIMKLKRLYEMKTIVIKLIDKPQMIIKGIKKQWKVSNCKHTPSLFEQKKKKSIKYTKNMHLKKVKLKNKMCYSTRGNSSVFTFWSNQQKEFHAQG